jgi:hypothetical protein
MPAPPPDQAPQETESIALGRFDGLKNTVKRERLSARDLARAVNIDLDDDGQIHRRRGTTKVASGEFHSLFQANNSVAYGVKNGDLGVINPDYSFDLLRMGVGGDYNNGEPAVAYVQVGSSIYFSSTSASGIIDTTTNLIGDWGSSQDIWLSPVVNPTNTLPEVGGKLIGRPPLATSLAYFKGRIYLAQGRSLWATELYLYQFVDKTRTFFTYESEIVFVGAVSDGLYIGTTDGVYFMSGEFPQRRVKIMDSPAVPGSLVYVPGELANPPQVGLQADEPASVSIGFMTTTGFCVGSEGGHAVNLTESRVFFPKAQRAATLFRRQDGFNQYIMVADHEGSPAGNAAIGDYVDALIVRGRDKWTQITEGLNIYDQFTPLWR